MAEEKLEVESLTLPRPSRHTPESDEHARKRQEQRRERLGDERYTRAQERYEELRDVTTGTPFEQAQAEYEEAEAYKDKVVERTREKLEDGAPSRPAGAVTTGETRETGAPSGNPANAIPRPGTDPLG